MITRRSFAFSVAGLGAAGLLLGRNAAFAAEKKYAPGVSDTEIKLGQTMPYSGPASAYGTQGRAEAAYFAMVNEKGGVNGRKINFLSLDDGYSPPKTIEQTRKLVESEQIFADVGSLGTPTNTAIHKYLNSRKVPHILVSTGASKWNDPKHFPWSMPFYPSYDVEGFILGKYVATTKPDAKVAILYQHDDAGKDYVAGFKKGLGPNAAKMVVAEASYEVTDPTVDSQIVTLQGSGADTLFNMTTPKFGAQAVRKVYDLGWRPLHLIVSVASSIAGVLEPAGLDKSVGLITAQAFKTPNDPTWAEDKGMEDYLAFMKKYYPEGNPTDASNVLGYTAAELVRRLLERCGDELTRENLMKQVMSMKQEEMPLLLPGVKLDTSPTDVNPFHGMRTARFDGKSWVLFGDLITADDLKN